MTEPDQPTASDRLRAIAYDLRRLSPCHHNPHLFHECKHDLVVRTEKLADELKGQRPIVSATPPEKGKVETGTIAVKGRVIPITSKAPRRPR